MTTLPPVLGDQLTRTITSDGPGANPFNRLHRNFPLENADELANNPRMAMTHRNHSRFAPEKRARLRADAERFLDALA